MLDVIGKNIIAIRMKTDEDVFSSLKEVLEKYDVKSGIILGAIGMLKDFTLRYWNGEEHVETDIDKSCELLSMQGNISHDVNSELTIHIHVALAMESKNLLGGHLVKGKVSNTCEMFIFKLDGLDLLRKPQESDILQIFPRLLDC